MKILLLSDSYLPHMGGSRVYYHNLYKPLAVDYGDQVTILTKRVPGWEAFDGVESNGGLQILRSGEPLESLKYWHLPRIIPTFGDTLQAVFRQKTEMIHAGDLYPQGVIGIWAKRFLGLPCISYCHGEQITQTESYRFQPILRNWLYQNSDAVIANSEFTCKHLIRIGVEASRIHKITPGVDWERFSPRPKNMELVKKYDLAGKKVILTVARLIARKGHAAVLHAVAHLSKSIPDLAYVIAGEGPEEEILRRLTNELGISAHVRFAGRVSEEALPDFFNVCDIFAMPNYDGGGGDIEGFGMVFLEANAAGKPVIGGRSGGSSDAVAHGETGYLVDNSDREELISTLSSLLLQDSLREKLGSAGLKRARNSFSWPARARLLREVSFLVRDSVNPSSPRP